MEPYDNPFWYGMWKRERKKINLPKIVAYLSCSAGRTNFARTYKKQVKGVIQSRNDVQKCRLGYAVKIVYKNGS